MNQRTNINSETENSIDNLNIIGEGSVAIRGVEIVNKPTIPHVEVNFNTKAAPQMLFSSKRPGDAKAKSRFVNGADWFDTKLKPIFLAIRDDDPFADQLLLDIEQQIKTLGEHYQQAQQEIKSELEAKFARNNANIILSNNTHCLTYKVTFENRLAYDLLWLVKELDNILYYYYLADKYAVVDVKEINDKRHELKRKFRQVLGLINNWKPTSITREDLAYNTARVGKTFEVNKAIELTKEVLLMEERARCAPEVGNRKGDILDPAIKDKLLELYG